MLKTFYNIIIIIIANVNNIQTIENEAYESVRIKMARNDAYEFAQIRKSNVSCS